MHGDDMNGGEAPNTDKAAAESQMPEEKPQDAANELQLALAREAELKDRLLRALAETENLRRRAERDKEDALQYAITRFARDLLGVVDNFRRALASVPSNLDENDPLKPLLDGVVLTEKELMRVLALHGVKPEIPKGQKFDPHRHQAIAQVPSTLPEGTVVDVAQIGFMIGDRLLRPAMVMVSAGAGPVPAGSAVDQTA